MVQIKHNYCCVFFSQLLVIYPFTSKKVDNLYNYIEIKMNTLVCLKLLDGTKGSILYLLTLCFAAHCYKLPP